MAAVLRRILLAPRPVTCSGSDLANRFANNGYGQLWMLLDKAGAATPARAGLTDSYGLIWTSGILLRIRRSASC